MNGTITKIPTKDMSREEWLAARQNSLGGSDAASVLGLNQYNSPYGLWAEKTGAIIKEDISDQEAVRLGNDLEQYVAERFMEATGKKVQRINFILKNDQYPFAHANPDRMVVGENAGLEIKTTTSWDIEQQLRNGDIPPYWYCQIIHYMMVTGAERWYLGALVFGRGFFHFTIERNEAEIEALAGAERDFWELVTSNTPPAIDGHSATTDALKAIFPESAPGSSIDLTICGANIDRYVELGKQIKALEAEQAEEENLIKNCMGSCESGTYGSTKISWKTSKRSTFDKKRYEEAHGKIGDEYYNTTESRAFRVTMKKGA